MDGGIGIMRGIIDIQDCPVFQREAVTNAGNGQNDGQIVLPLQPFLNDIQMKQSQKAAAEALPQGGGRILLINKGGIIEFEFFQGVGQVFIIIGSNGIDGRKDNGLDFFESGQGFFTGPVCPG